MLLDHVPSARPNKEDRWLWSKRIELPFRRYVLDGSAIRVSEVSLTFKAIAPGRCGRILEISHEDIRPGVQGIDDHLSLDRTRNLHSSIKQAWRDRSDPPLRFANVARLGGKLGHLARIELGLALIAFSQQINSSGFKTPTETTKEFHCLWSEYLGLRRVLGGCIFEDW